MSDTRWDLRRIEDRHPDEFDRPAVRLVRAASQVANEQTTEIPVVLRHSSGGCRTKVDGVRCRHDQPSHYEVGHSGWRMRCRGCPCTTWRAPFSEPVGDAAIGLGVALILVLLFWFAVVPALIEMMT